MLCQNAIRLGLWKQQFRRNLEWLTLGVVLCVAAGLRQVALGIPAICRTVVRFFLKRSSVCGVHAAVLQLGYCRRILELIVCSVYRNLTYGTTKVLIRARRVAQIQDFRMLRSRQSQTRGNAGTESFRSKGTCPYDSGVARQTGRSLRKGRGFSPFHCSCIPAPRITSRADPPAPGSRLWPGLVFSRMNTVALGEEKCEYKRASDRSG